MTTAVIRPAPPNRLAKLIKLPGGISLAQALGQAESNVAALAEPALELLDVELERLAAAAARLLAQPEDATLVDKVYTVATEIVGIAEVAGQKQVGQAAYGLCNLTDRFRDSGRFSAPALQVHLTALRRLRLPPTAADAPARKAMLEGLAQVVQTV